METIETINQRLIDYYGIDSDTGRPIFRIVWANDQTEKRKVTTSEFGIQFIHPIVMEVKKYPYLKDLHVLERLVVVPDADREEIIVSKLSYEPLWSFHDAAKNPVYPVWEATKFIVDSLYAALGKKSLAKYVESEDETTQEGRQEQIAQLQGEFPGLGNSNRRTIRAPVNPMDKSTVISILPKVVPANYATIQPGYFELGPGSFANPAVLVIGPSSWWREVDENQPLLEIPVSSIQIADSIVRDYCNGLLACNMSDQMPGIFYVPGDFTLERLRKDHMPLLLSAQAKQKKWYLELVKIADIMWSRSNGNPLSISDDARLACRELNITQKPWLGDLQTAELVRCIACGNLRNPQFPICSVCKAIADPEKAKALGLTFAQ